MVCPAGQFSVQPGVNSQSDPEVGPAGQLSARQANSAPGPESTLGPGLPGRSTLGSWPGDNPEVGPGSIQRPARELARLVGPGAGRRTQIFEP